MPCLVKLFEGGFNCIILKTDLRLNIRWAGKSVKVTGIGQKIGKDSNRNHFDANISYCCGCVCIHFMNYVTDSIEKNSYQDSFSASKKKKKFPHFIQPEISLSCSQQNENSPYPEADKFRSQCSAIPIFWSILILSSKPRLSERSELQIPTIRVTWCAHTFLLDCNNLVIVRKGKNDTIFQ